MVCKICGANNTDDAKFCANCGEVFENVAAEQAETSFEYDPNVASVEPDFNTTTVVTDPGKTFGLISMIIGIVSAVLGVACTCALGCIGGTFPALVGVAGFVLGIIGMNKSKQAGFKNKNALIGIILSGVGIGAILIITIINFAIGASGAATDVLEELF